MLEFVSVLPTTGDSGWLGTLKPDRQPSFDVLRDAALTAEGVGFEACLITTGHTNNHFADQVGYVDSIVTASALVPVTGRLRLLVAIRPGWVDAAACARMSATLDQFSGGRFMINVVSGGAPALMYGEDLDDTGRHQRASEFAQVLHALWTQDEASFQGRYFALREARCWPKPYQQPRPPVYVAGSSPATLDMAARWADCLLLPGVTEDPLGEVHDGRSVEHDGKPRSAAEHLMPVQRGRRARGTRRLMGLDDTVAEGGYLLRGKEAREHHKPVLGEVTLPSIHGLRRHGGGQAASVVHHPRLRAPSCRGGS